MGLQTLYNLHCSARVSLISSDVLIDTFKWGTIYSSIYPWCHCSRTNFFFFYCQKINKSVQMENKRFLFCFFVFSGKVFFLLYFVLQNCSCYPGDCFWRVFNILTFNFISALSVDSTRFTRHDFTHTLNSHLISLHRALSLHVSLFPFCLCHLSEAGMFFERKEERRHSLCVCECLYRVLLSVAFSSISTHNWDF